MHQLIIFRLKHVKGIGNIGRLRLLNYLLENSEDVCFQTMIHLAKVKPTHQSMFIESFKESQKNNRSRLRLFFGTIWFVNLFR